MKVVFRADASLQIGTGHVMRCLTLAEALAAEGADCRFICREHPGNLIDQVRSKNYVVHTLPAISVGASVLTAGQFATTSLSHSHWLGATQEQDAEVCGPILGDLKPDWLIADHYALDARWERTLKPYYRKLMVIDDLADRPHQCDVLLDQTFQRDSADYLPWVPEACTLLCGSRYALLRPEFAALRTSSLARRTEPRLKHLLVALGGVDKDNITEKTLEVLSRCSLPNNCQVAVVLGSTAPWLTDVKRRARSMPWNTTVHAGYDAMARLMADSDLAIGAAGTTSWERCCLGLPTILVTLAENQREIARRLEESGCVKLVPEVSELEKSLPPLIRDIEKDFLIMSHAAAQIVDGQGISAVTKALRV